MIKVRCLKDGKVFRPANPMKYQETGGDQSPVIKVAKDGLVWLLYHTPRTVGYTVVPNATWKAATFGRFNYAMYYDGNKWSTPMSFESLPARADSDHDFVILDDGRLLGVWHSDNKTADTDRKYTDNHIYPGTAEPMPLSSTISDTL